MLYLAFFDVYTHIACPHKHTGGLIIINSKYFSFSDWPEILRLILHLALTIVI